MNGKIKIKPAIIRVSVWITLRFAVIPRIQKTWATIKRRQTGKKLILGRVKHRF